MDFSSIGSLCKEGFKGFIPFSKVEDRKKEILELQGVYLIVSPPGFKMRFLKTRPGGFYTNKYPNFLPNNLAANWVENAIVLYIGKSGGKLIKATLPKRIISYRKFGTGKSSRHRGGRIIWQLQDSEQLLLCWKSSMKDPSKVKTDLIASFRETYGARPFANLRN